MKVLVTGHNGYIGAVRKGVDELYAAFRRYGLTEEAFMGPSYQRLKRVRGLLDSGELDSSLRWRQPVLSSAIGD